MSSGKEFQTVGQQQQMPDVRTVGTEPVTWYRDFMTTDRT